MLKVNVTGHRPNRLNKYSKDWINDELKRVLVKLKPTICYTGMAIGVDQEFAEICYDLKIPYIAVIPFEGQEVKWSQEDQFKYCDIIQKAYSSVTVCSPGYEAWKMQRRNEWMVDEIGMTGVVIAVWDGSTGGTKNCYTYAKKIGRTIIRINPVTQETTKIV